MQTPRLVGTGRSSRGWSRLGSFRRCPAWYAYNHVVPNPHGVQGPGASGPSGHAPRLPGTAGTATPQLPGTPTPDALAPASSTPTGVQLIPKDPLTRGSIAHTALAHRYARGELMKRHQRGDTRSLFVGDELIQDADALLRPEAAMEAWCDRAGYGHEWLERMTECYRHWCIQVPEIDEHVVAVEWPVELVLGVKHPTQSTTTSATTPTQPSWGLWVNALASDGTRRTPDGAVVEPTPLRCPGHPRDGEAIVLTRRIDLVVRRRDGRVRVVDHKGLSRIEPGRARDAYALDGGFAAFRLIGRQVWPADFDGVWLYLWQTTSPWRHSKVEVDATPFRDGGFARQLWDDEHALARLEVETWEGTRDPWHWPRCDVETGPCFGRWGRCQAIEICKYGPGVLDDPQQY